MLRRKAKRLGKKGFKYRLVVTVHNVELQQGPECRLDDYNGRTYAEWNEPLGMVATLYKDERSVTFEDKAYDFRVCQTKNGKLSKQLCTGALNMAVYAASEDSNTQVTVPLQPTNSASVIKGILRISIACEPAGADDSTSVFESLSDTSSVNLTADDEAALETASLQDSPELAAYKEKYSESLATLHATKGKGKHKATEALNVKFSDDALHGKSAEQLRQLIVELRTRAQADQADQEAVHSALLSDYANTKVRLAQAEYEKDRIRLERLRLAHQLAQLKLKVIEQQQAVTKLEARLNKKG